MKNRTTLAAALILGVLSVVALRPSIRGVDGVGNYVYLMSILNDGDLDFTDEYAAFDFQRSTSYRLSDASISPVTGRPANRYGIGSALFWAPPVMIVHGILSFFAPDMADGMTPPYAWGVAIGSAWWASLGLWMLFLRIGERFGAGAAWTSCAGLTLATPLIFYGWMHGSMSHAVSFFVSVMGLLAFERLWTAPSSRLAFITGLWAGLLMITRMQDVTWAVALGMGTALVGLNRPGRTDDAVAASRLDWRPIAFFTLGAALAFAPQMAVWKYLYGSWLSGPLPYFNRGHGNLGLWPVHLGDVLFSERGGFLAWHPILAIGLGGLILGRRALGRPLVAVALVGLALQIYLISCWSMWWGGASFGNRFFISALPYLAMGLAWALDRMRRIGPAWSGPLVVAILIAWNMGLLVQYGAGMIPREQEAGWPLVISNQFQAVPAWVIEHVEAILP